MNIGMIVCGVLCILFLIFALVFMLLKERAVMLISGFNTLSKATRDMYDTTRLSLDQRNQFLLWAVIFGIGCLLSYVISQDMAIMAFLVWLVFFFKDVHLYADKAFAKYKKR